jgi:hypothetical protein
VACPARAPRPWLGAPWPPVCRLASRPRCRQRGQRCDRRNVRISSAWPQVHGRQDGRQGRAGRQSGQRGAKPGGLQGRRAVARGGSAPGAQRGWDSEHHRHRGARVHRQEAPIRGPAPLRGGSGTREGSPKPGGAQAGKRHALTPGSPSAAPGATPRCVKAARGAHPRCRATWGEQWPAGSRQGKPAEAGQQRRKKAASYQARSRRPTGQTPRAKMSHLERDSCESRDDICRRCASSPPRRLGAAALTPCQHPCPASRVRRHQ